MTDIASKKRILIFSTAYYPFYSGAEIAVHEITKRLGSEYEFDLITTRLKREWPKIEVVGAVTVYRVGFGLHPFVDKLLSPFLGALLVRRLHAQKNYATFWALMVTFTSGAAYLANALFRLTVPVILTLQEGDSETHIEHKRFGLIKRSWKWALARSQMVTVISTYLEKRARHYGFTKDVVLIPNGVSHAAYTAELSDGERAKIRAQHAIPDKALCLITTSRLSHKNAVDVVVRALKHLPDTHFLVVGDGEEQAALRALAQEEGVSDRTHFLGFIEQERIPSFLKSADVFIRPSRSEGMGNSFIEAMAAELPVIATQEGGIADFLFDAKRNPDTQPTGFAVDKDSPEQIVEAVGRIVNSPEETRQTIENAKRLVHEKYDWDLIAKDMREKVFAKVLSR